MSEICHACKLGPCPVNAGRCDGLETDLESLSTPVKTDWYAGAVTRDGGEIVSIEQAAGRELRLKNELDDQVEGENVYHIGMVINGLPPCKRVKKSF